MPLTANNLNHIRNNYRKEMVNRTLPVTIHFQDGSSLTINAVWRQNNLNDPEMIPQNKQPQHPMMMNSDAAIMVHTDDISIGQLEAALYVTPSNKAAIDDPGIAGRYIVTSVQPRSVAYPAARAYATLKKI